MFEHVLSWHLSHLAVAPIILLASCLSTQKKSSLALELDIWAGRYIRYIESGFMISFLVMGIPPILQSCVSCKKNSQMEPE